jgi:integrase/recombinase XerD
MKTKLTFSQTVEGYLMAAQARRLSPNTLDGYNNAYAKFAAHLAADPPLITIDKHIIEDFLASQETVTKATLLKYHTSLCALWSWAVAEHIVEENIPHLVTRPKAEIRAIQPIPEADVRALLSAVAKSKTYTRPGKRASSHTLHQADRNRAIILTLLDTGIRASELCALEIRHADLRNRDKFITIRDGKGSKDRRVPISQPTALAIWRYLKTRPESRIDEPLFATETNHHLLRDNLGNMLEATAHRAGIVAASINPHRFRHTFAINYLRNGGDIYTLRSILGHESLEMCLRYLAIAQGDIDSAHRRASPVDHWRL